MRIKAISIVVHDPSGKRVGETFPLGSIYRSGALQERLDRKTPKNRPNEINELRTPTCTQGA
jgi:hypothetical protein